MLIQLSCQDLLYISNFKGMLDKILNNPYYFPPKKIKVKKKPTISQRNQNSMKLTTSIKFATEM
jgi:hypothetical protein